MALLRNKNRIHIHLVSVVFTDRLTVAMADSRDSDGVSRSEMVKFIEVVGINQWLVD